MNKERIEWIDTLKGFGIILVVFGHLNGPLWLETYIYSFHMPMFFFISGYLMDLDRQIALKDFIKKKAKGLLVPYLFFGLISIPFGILRSILMGAELNLTEIPYEFFYLKGSVGWNEPLWFLVCLFVVEVTVFILLKDRKKAIYPVMAVSGLLGIACTFLPFRLPFSIDIAAVVIPFFLFGNIVKQKALVEKIYASKKLRITMIFFFFTYNVLFGNILNIRISIYSFNFGNLLYFYISAAAGIMLYVLAAYGLKKSRVLEFYGKNTLLILATHYFAFALYTLVGHKILNYDFMFAESLIIPIIVTLISMLLYVPMARLFNRYLPVVVGKPKITVHGE